MSYVRIQITQCRGPAIPFDSASAYVSESAARAIAEILQRDMGEVPPLDQEHVEGVVFRLEEAANVPHRAALAELVAGVSR